MFKLKIVCGVGINDADYPINSSHYKDGKQVITWRCPFYERWAGMLKRCYSKKFQDSHPTYRGVLVCKEWLTFSNFKAWMERQDWEDNDLDKDLLFPDKKIYSPETCVFIPSYINTMFLENGATRGSFPIGVSLYKRNKKNPYQSRIRNETGKQIHIGFYDSAYRAHRAWQIKKVEYCNLLLSRYQKDHRYNPIVFNSLNKKISVIISDIKKEKETNTTLGGKNV